MKIIFTRDSTSKAIKTCERKKYNLDTANKKLRTLKMEYTFISYIPVVGVKDISNFSSTP